jgi:hypothetical protein
MITPAQAVRKILIDQHLATDAVNADWRCVLFQLPDGAGVRDNVIAVVDGEGAVGDRYVSTSEIVMQPRIRILCRSVSYNMGYSKMLQIADVLDVVVDYPIIIGNESATLYKTSRNSGIMSGGSDVTSRRYTFSLDYEISLR